jgi:hypothetical protein
MQYPAFVNVVTGPVYGYRNLCGCMGKGRFFVKFILYIHSYIDL